MYSPFKMKGKSPMMKALIGKQNNLPAELKAKIEASPAKKDKPELNQAQSDTVNSYARSMPGFQYMKKENKKKVTDSIDRLDGYRATKKEAYRQFDATDKNKTKDSATKMKKASPAKGVKLLPKEGTDPNKSSYDLYKQTGMGPRVKKASPSKMKKKSPAKAVGEKPETKTGEFSWIKGGRWETGTAAEMKASLGLPKKNKAQTILARKQEEEKDAPTKMKKKSSMKMMKKK